MTNALAAVSPQSLAGFCEEHGVARLWAFGSVLREDFDPANSDIDLLVEFLPGVSSGFLKLAEMRLSLCDAFNREVDLITPRGLHPQIRKSVQSEAYLLYAHE